MNGYIIEPMWFYWVKVLDRINIIALLTLIVGAIALFFSFVMMDNYLYNEEREKWRKIIRPSFVVVVLSAIILVFVPSSDTLIKMKLAEFGTYENVEAAIEAIQDATDYILEHLK